MFKAIHKQCPTVHSHSIFHRCNFTTYSTESSAKHLASKLHCMAVLFLLDSHFHKNQSYALIWKSPVIWKHQQMMLMTQWNCEVNWLSGNGIPIPVMWYQYLYPLYSLVIELEFFHDSVRVMMGIWLSGCLVFVCWFSFIVFLVILLLFPCIYMYSHIGGLVFLGFQGQGGAQKYYQNPVCRQITIDLPQSPYI